ncbi:MucR family transcriptional regulator [Methylobacterium nodulans]|uniref:Transcriptional regulator, MucR family n=1 Tax=Methylobacterium nodulans (strain LMG 21967 / CNCM I-2342 / ORS 2060) TaxID=460265 RepID=B8IWL6_METNO|nr:MucR family transcriptional regulator [Methylobacterium nodulans]ACL62806.1 transcriptional regulator, MucR family [Methylobacterium nodulans ORS 2060]
MGEEAKSITLKPETETIGLTANIVSAYVSNNVVPAAELPELIAIVDRALDELSKPATPVVEEVLKPTAAQIRKSITPDHLISFIDGKPYKSMKRHLTKNGLTPAEYRQQYGLPANYPMVAPNYAAQRSELAKSLGLGQMRRQRAAEKRADTDAKVSAPAEPKKGRGRPKKAAASE